MSDPYYYLDPPTLDSAADPIYFSPSSHPAYDLPFHMNGSTASRKRREPPSDAGTVDTASPCSTSRKLPRLDEDPHTQLLRSFSVLSQAPVLSPQAALEDDALLDPFTALGQHFDLEQDPLFHHPEDTKASFDFATMHGCSLPGDEALGMPAFCSSPQFCVPGPSCEPGLTSYPCSQSHYDPCEQMAFCTPDLEYPQSPYFNPEVPSYGSLPRTFATQPDLALTDHHIFSTSAPAADTGFMFNRPPQPRPCYRSESPQQIPSRPSFPLPSRSTGSARIVVPSSQTSSNHGSPHTSTPGQHVCNRCGISCRGEKALNRHVLEQHEMTVCHLCPLCSNLVEFDNSGDPAKPLKCSHCDDEDVHLSPAEIVPHFTQHHYHCLSSSRMYFIKRPLDLSRHFKAKQERDDGHQWLYASEGAVAAAKEHFKIEDASTAVVRGCDHCEQCMTSLADFVNHVSQTWKDGHRHSDKPDKAFSMQVLNLLQAPRLRAAWAALVTRTGETERRRWKYSGAEASQLLRDLEHAASEAGDADGRLCARAYGMMED